MVFVIVNVAVEGGTEAVDEAHRPEACVRTRAAALDQMRLDDTQKDSQDSAKGLRLALQVPAQPFGHREDPLAHRQRREDVIDQVRRGLRHASGVARGAQPAPLAREGDQEVMAAVRTSGPGEAVGEDAALKVTTKFAFDMGRHALPVPVVFTRKREPPDITWHGVELDDPGWDDGNAHTLAYMLAGLEADDPHLYVMLNMWDDTLDFALPALEGRRWHRAVDTSAEQAMLPPEEQPALTDRTYRVGPRSLVVLEGRA